MGKAALDLPDPLQSPLDEAKPLTSTDDLLARLAGEEIDRLLAEVDDQPGAAAPIALAPKGTAAESKLVDPIGAVPAKAPQVPPATDDRIAAEIVAAAEPDLTAELDAFFKSAAPASANTPLAADPLETTQAERLGLHAQARDPAAIAAGRMASPPAPQRRSTAPVSPVDAAEPDTDAGTLPPYLKPLEWINAPLEACPPAMRDFIGKAAIITLVNAAAVLLYVVLFRHR